jgi:hypothetical protein
MKPVSTLTELRSLSGSDPHYEALTILASRELGGRAEASLEEHQEWLRIYALATAEEHVVERVNRLMPQIDLPLNARCTDSTA